MNPDKCKRCVYLTYAKKPANSFCWKTGSLITEIDKCFAKEVRFTSSKTKIANKEDLK